MRRAHAVFTLLLVEAVSFGFCIRRLGFYQDDWALLHHVYDGSAFGFRHGLKAFWSAGVAARPLSIPIYAALCHVGGWSPLPYQLAMLLANALAAIAFFFWVERVTKDRRLALLAAALGAVSPAHPATHHWMTHILQPLAHALALAAMTVHVRWVSARDRRAAAAAGALFAAAVLTKESVAFLPLASAVWAYLRARAGGAARRDALRRLPADLLPFAAGFGIGVLWSWGIKGTQQPLRLAPSTAWTLRVYRSALEALTLETFALVRKTFWFFLEIADDAQLLLLALFTGMTAALATSEYGSGDAPVEDATRLTLCLAAACFVASYAPYALSGGYLPQIVGGMSRTSELGAWSAALALAALLPPAASRAAKALRFRGAPQARVWLGSAVACLVAASTWTNWFIALQWAGSWSLQQSVLDSAIRWTPKLPPKATLLIPGVPHFVNGTEVFHEGRGDWPFAFAYRLKTGRDDVTTALPTGRLVATPQGVGEEDGGAVFRLFPWKDLYQLDVASGKLTRVVP